MIVIERVEDLTPILTTADQAHLAKSAQLMGYGRFGHFQPRCDIAHVHFTFQ